MAAKSNKSTDSDGAVKPTGKKKGARARKPASLPTRQSTRVQNQKASANAERAVTPASLSPPPPSPPSSPRIDLPGDLEAASLANPLDLTIPADRTASPKSQAPRVEPNSQATPPLSPPTTQPDGAEAVSASPANPSGSTSPAVGVASCNTKAPSAQSNAPPLKSVVRRGKRAVQASAPGKGIIWLDVAPGEPTAEEVHNFDVVNHQTREEYELWRLPDTLHAFTRCCPNVMQGVHWSSDFFFDKDGSPALGNSAYDRFQALVATSSANVRTILKESPTLYSLFVQQTRFLDGWSNSVHHITVTWDDYKSLGLIATLPGTTFTTNSQRKQLLRVATTAICLDRMWAAICLWSDPSANLPRVFDQTEPHPSLSNTIQPRNRVYRSGIDVSNHPAARLCRESLTWRSRFEERGSSKAKKTVPTENLENSGELAAVLWSSLRKVEERSAADAAESNITRCVLACITSFGYASVHSFNLLKNEHARHIHILYLFSIDREIWMLPS